MGPANTVCTVSRLGTRSAPRNQGLWVSRIYGCHTGWMHPTTGTHRESGHEGESEESRSTGATQALAREAADG